MMNGMLCLGIIAVSAASQTISYTPLSEEAARTGRLDRYKSVPTSNHRLELGGMVLDVTVPVSCEAYDCVPIEYQLRGSADAELAAVEAAAFEESWRRGKEPLYDLALPGKLEARIEYLGSQTGVLDPERVKRLAPNSPTGEFPPFELHPFVRSATVERGNNLWFKFRITNTGNTILDPEGFGAWMTRLLVYRIGKDGARELAARSINHVNRHLDYMYPGESVEQWSDVMGTGQPISHVRTLLPGKYLLVFELMYRDNREYDWIINMWEGRPWMALEVPIDVVDQAKKPAESEVDTRTVSYEAPDMDRMTRYFERFEEFMTSFDVYRAREALSVRRTMYVQVAPWSEEIVIKLITNKPGGLHTAAVPIKVLRDQMAVRYNKDNPFAFVRPDGKREPWILTQAMPAMRTTSQLGPHPEAHLRARLKEMQELGINVICTTGGDWHLREAQDPNAFAGDIHAETYKYYYDVITQELKMPVLGWGIFPPKTSNTSGIGNLYWGTRTVIPEARTGTAYSGRTELDIGHPDFARLYAGGILFNYDRWGEQWARTADGDVLIDVEDTWGWVRDDINLRYYLGDHCVRRFREWLVKKYGNIEAANRVWEATYASFNEVDPQKNQNDGGEAYGVSLKHVAPEYTNPGHPFHDWSPAVEDWDRFRTELRSDIYDEIQRIVREKIPNARINLRTEGACILAEVPQAATEPHLRHIQHALRRNALMMDILKERKTFKYHSDYTTLPYSESELRQLLRNMREAGMRGNYLPQFDHMRDMLLNDTYGREWQVHYNLPDPKRALMVHCLTAAYPWFRIMYEEGHCPGLLWEDYLCDGFATVTQKKEVRLFRDALDKAVEEQ